MTLAVMGRWSTDPESRKPPTSASACRARANRPTAPSTSTVSISPRCGAPTTSSPLRFANWSTTTSPRGSSGGRRINRLRFKPTDAEAVSNLFRGVSKRLRRHECRNSPAPHDEKRGPADDQSQRKAPPQASDSKACSKTERIPERQSDEPVSSEVPHHRSVCIPEAPENAGGDSLNTVEELEHRRNREQDTPTSSTDVSCVKLPMMGRPERHERIPPHKA